MLGQLRHHQTKGAENSRVWAKTTAPHLDSTPHFLAEQFHGEQASWQNGPFAGYRAVSAALLTGSAHFGGSAENRIRGLW